MSGCGLLYRNDAEGMLGVLIADRHVLAGHEGMRPEAVPGLVIVQPRVVIVEYPPRMLVTARLVHETADLVCLALPKSPHVAVVSMRFPRRDIDVTARVKRRCELVAVQRRPVRMLP